MYASWINYGCIMVFLWRLGSFKVSKRYDCSLSQLVSAIKVLVIRRRALE
jgi:hypothetical protein